MRPRGGQRLTITQQVSDKERLPRSRCKGTESRGGLALRRVQ